MRGEQRPRSGLGLVSSTGPVVFSNNRCQPVTRSNHFLCVIFSWPTTHTFARLPLSTTYIHYISSLTPFLSVSPYSPSDVYPLQLGHGRRTREHAQLRVNLAVTYLDIRRSVGPLPCHLWHSITVSWPRSFFAAAKIFCLSTSLHYYTLSWMPIDLPRHQCLVDARALIITTR